MSVGSSALHDAPLTPTQAERTALRRSIDAALDAARSGLRRLPRPRSHRLSSRRRPRGPGRVGDRARGGRTEPRSRPVPVSIRLPAGTSWVQRPVGTPRPMDEDLAITLLTLAGMGPERTLGVAREVHMEEVSHGDNGTISEVQAQVTGVGVIVPPGGRGRRGRRYRGPRAPHRAAAHPRGLPHRRARLVDDPPRGAAGLPPASAVALTGAAPARDAAGTPAVLPRHRGDLADRPLRRPGDLRRPHDPELLRPARQVDAVCDRGRRGALHRRHLA